MTDRVKGLFSYSPDNPEELQFNAQDIITVVGPSDDSTHWWYGALDNKLGLFPLNYVVCNIHVFLIRTQHLHPGLHS
jgi:hypothetical protein